jgi:hypothetical protein
MSSRRHDGRRLRQGISALADDCFVGGDTEGGYAGNPCAGGKLATNTPFVPSRPKMADVGSALGGEAPLVGEDRDR